MKKYLLGALLLAPGPSFAQTTYPFVVKGKIGSLNAPAKIYLVGGQQLDSATLKNGQFEFKGANQWLGSAELILERQGKLRENYTKQSQFPVARPHHRVSGARPCRSYQPRFADPRAHHGRAAHGRLSTPECGAKTR